MSKKSTPPNGWREGRRLHAPVQALAVPVQGIVSESPKVSQSRSLQPPPLSAILTALLNELANASEQTAPILLILDDYQLIEDPTIDEALIFWRSICPNMCIWCSPAVWTRTFLSLVGACAGSWPRFAIPICAFARKRRAAF
jgi:ATP/maltotriose-dependent transcriptional regulator MalT